MLDGREYVKFASGSIKLDHKKEIVRVQLKVEMDGKIDEFEGNGLYLMKKKEPNKAPEPTPTSVTPPANESKAK